MKRPLIILLTLIISFSLSGQNKIIFSQGLKKVKIKVGKYIGVTQKKESFKFESWESICTKCADSISYQNIWTLDSIDYNYIVVRQLIDHDSAYIYDTITYEEKYKSKNKYYDWIFVDEIRSSDGDILKNRLVYAYPIVFKRNRILTENIQSVSFAKNNYCNIHDSGYLLTTAVLIIGTPFAAFDEGTFNASIFAIGEGLGLLMVYSIYKKIQNNKVKTYQVGDWEMKIK